MGNVGLIRDQRYRTDPDAGMPMLDWCRWQTLKIPKKDKLFCIPAFWHCSIYSIYDISTSFSKYNTSSNFVWTSRMYPISITTPAVWTWYILLYANSSVYVLCAGCITLHCPQHGHGGVFHCQQCVLLGEHCQQYRCAGCVHLLYTASSVDVQGV